MASIEPRKLQHKGAGRTNMLSLLAITLSICVAAEVREELRRRIPEQAPDLDVDGEMQVGAALDVEQRGRLFNFSTLKDEANILIFPELNSANTAYKLMRHLGGADAVGPILIGMNRAVNVLERDCSVRAVVNMAAITVVQAQDIAQS